MLPDTVSARDLLRHSLATIAYRCGKALRDAPASFADFHAGESARTPVQILSQVSDLFDWALSLAKGKQSWRDSKPLPWPQVVERFFQSLKNLDDYLAGIDPIQPLPSNSFKAPSPMLSTTSARSPCSAAWQALPSRERITTRPTSLSAASARTNLRRIANFKKHLFPFSDPAARLL